jgi:hypothetical protein
MDVRDEQEQRRELLARLGQAELARLFDRVDGVPGAVREPDDLRLRALSLQHERREVGAVERMAHLADHRSAEALDDLGRVARKRMAEGVIRSEEVPALSALLRHGGRRAARERVGVVRPVQAERAAGLTGQIGRGRAHMQREPPLLPREVLDRQRHGRVRQVDDHVDALVVPAPGDVRADIRLVEMVGRDNLDRLAQDLAPEILDGHPDCDDGAGTGGVRARAGHVRQNADPHGIAADPAPGLGGSWHLQCEGRRECCGCHEAALANAP